MPVPNNNIKRLPPRILHILNLRLASGDAARDNIYWINNDPEAREVLDDGFSKVRITEQDILDWDIQRKAALAAAATASAPVSPVPTQPKPANTTNPPPEPKPESSAKPISVPHTTPETNASKHTQPAPPQRQDGGRGVPPLNPARETHPTTPQQPDSGRGAPPLSPASDTRPMRPNQPIPESRSAHRAQSPSSMLSSARALAKSAAEIVATGLCAEHILIAITALYAGLLENWEGAHGASWSQNGEIHFNRRLIALQDLTKAALALRKSEQCDARLELDRQRLQLLREKQRSKTSTSAPSSTSPSHCETPLAPQPVPTPKEASPIRERQSPDWPATSLTTATEPFPAPDSVTPNPILV